MAIAALAQGRAVTVRPRGHSMRGLINDGDEVCLVPCTPGDLQVGDAVLVRVHGQVYLHRIVAMQQDRCLIGNNVGGLNGWTPARAVLGLATHAAGRPLRRGGSR
jgi:hypothetical protein